MTKLKIIMATIAALAAGLAQADTPPIVPVYLAQELTGVGHVTGTRPPVGNGDGIGGCTGTLITPTLFLTAAHCAAGRVSRPQDLYITFGWSNNGPPLWRGAASRIILYPEYIPDTYNIETLYLDLALVVLPRPVPEALVTPIPLRPGIEAESYGSFGYLARSDTVLRGQEGCQTQPITTNGLWGFDCDVVSGFSGGPLIALTEDGPVVAAVAVAHAPGINTGIRSFAAIPATRLFPDGVYPD